MACGLTKVGVIQSSQHTSELIMSRFMGSEMFDAGFSLWDVLVAEEAPASL